MRTPPGESFPAWVDALLFAIETELPTPRRDSDEPLHLLVIHGSTTYQLGDFMATHEVDGVVQRGRLRVRDEVVAVGLRGGGSRLTVSSIQRGNLPLQEAHPGDLVVVRFRPRLLGPVGVFPCQAIVAPTGWQTARRVIAHLSMLTPEQGGRFRPMPSGMHPRFSLGTVAFRARMELRGGQREVAPGAEAEIEIDIPHFGGILFEPGQTFVCRDHGRVIAVGRIESMIE